MRLLSGSPSRRMCYFGREKPLRTLSSSCCLELESVFVSLGSAHPGCALCSLHAPQSVFLPPCSSVPDSYQISRGQPNYPVNRAGHLPLCPPSSLLAEMPYLLLNLACVISFVCLVMDASFLSAYVSFLRQTHVSLDTVLLKLLGAGNMEMSSPGSLPQRKALLCLFAAFKNKNTNLLLSGCGPGSEKLFCKYWLGIYPELFGGTT